MFDALSLSAAFSRHNWSMLRCSCRGIPPAIAGWAFLTGMVVGRGRGRIGLVAPPPCNPPVAAMRPGPLRALQRGRADRRWRRCQRPSSPGRICCSSRRIAALTSGRLDEQGRLLSGLTQPAGAGAHGDPSGVTHAAGPTGSAWATPRRLAPAMAAQIASAPAPETPAMRADFLNIAVPLSKP